MILIGRIKFSNVFKVNNDTSNFPNRRFSILFGLEEEKM